MMVMKMTNTIPINNDKNNNDNYEERMTVLFVL